MPKIKDSVLSNFLYRIVETFGIQAMQLIISLVLARLLLPENYGVVAIATTIVTILTSVVQSSFNAPLVQKKELSQIDISSSFYVMLTIASTIYFLLFVLSPYISRIYNMPDLTQIIRVLSLILIIGAWNSVQFTIIYRTLKFRACMVINIASIILQGFVGILLAYLSFGVWSLVFSQLTHQITIGLLLGIYNKWRPSLSFSFKSIREIWKVGIPLCGSEMLGIVSSNLHPMIIGIGYTKSEIGFYQKGSAIPTTIIYGTVNACSSVFFPLMSRAQDDREKIMFLLRNGVSIASYLIVPLSLGLFCISSEFVTIVLGDNWLGAIPLMQIACLTLSLYPLRIRLQALKAIGKAEHVLFINTFYACTSILLLLVFVNISLEASIASLFIAELVFALVSGLFLNLDFSYSIIEQLKDVTSSYILSVLMAVVVIAVGKLFPEMPLFSLLVKIISGAFFYTACSLLIKPQPAMHILIYLKSNCL